MLGKDFNEKYGSENYIKLTRENCIHHNFQYKEGLNEDTNEFNPDKTCEYGGLFLCKRTNFVKWLLVSGDINDPMYYLWDVSIPDDALVTVMDNNTVKCNKFILSNKTSMWDNYDTCMEIVEKDGLFLHYVKNQTYDLCKASIKNDERAIGFVNNPSQDIYVEYVKLKAKNIENIPEKDLTPEFCVRLLEANSEVLSFIKSPSEQVLIFMVQQDGMKLKDIKNQTQQICMEAVIQNKKCFKFVQIDFRDKCKAYIKDYYDQLRANNASVN